MTATSRIVAVIVGLVMLVFVAADLVREAVLATHETISWPFVEWWSRLLAQPVWAGLAAAGAALVAVVLILLGARQMRRRRPVAGLVEFGDAANRARLDVAAAERALRRRLEDDLTGVKARELELTQRGGGWWVRFEADLPARDVLGVQRRAFGLLAGDLARMGGLRLDGVDVVVTRLA